MPARVTSAAGVLIMTLRPKTSSLTRRKFLKAGLLFVPSVALSQSVIIPKWYSGGHPVAVNWAYRVVKNGGQFPQPGVLLPTSQFCEAIDPLLGRIYCAGTCPPTTDFIGFRTPLITSPGALDPWVRHNVGTGGTGETLTINGWSPGSDRFNCQIYDTGLAPSAISAFTTGNAGMSCYIANSSTTNLDTNANMGGYDGTRAFLLTDDRASANQEDFYGWDASNIITVTTDHKGGFFLMSRTSTTVFKAYKAQSTIPWAQWGTTQTTLNTSTPLTTNIYVGGDLYPASVLHGTADIYSFFGVHDGFTSAEGQTLFNAVQALRVAYGGGSL